MLFCVFFLESNEINVVMYENDCGRTWKVPVLVLTSYRCGWSFRVMVVLNMVRL
jgi:hypothetical protein